MKTYFYETTLQGEELNEGVKRKVEAWPSRDVDSRGDAFYLGYLFKRLLGGQVDIYSEENRQEVPPLRENSVRN